MIRLLDSEKDDPGFFLEFEKASRFVKVNPEYTRARYAELIRKGMARVFILTDEEGNIQGGLGAVKYADLHSGELCAVETFWFVAPEFRHGLGALDLWRSFEEWADAEGCKRKYMIHLADSMPERLERVYVSRGYHLVEKMYGREIP